MRTPPCLRLRPKPRLTRTGTAPHSPNLAPFTYRPLADLDRRAKFHNQIVQAAIHTLRHETDQLEVALTLRPVPVDTFDVCGTAGQQGYSTPGSWSTSPLSARRSPPRSLS